MKLAIQIPCYNEEATLPGTLTDLPKPGTIPGIDEIVIVIIDDGCRDRTVAVAREWSKQNQYPMVIAHHTRNRGLAAAFQTGLNTCLRLEADIIVNTDADNQYPGHYIRDLVQPVIKKDADLVIADRQTDTIEHFSPLKKRFQKLGSLTVRIFSGSTVPDAVSGFRAFSREAALSMNLVTRYTYTIETIFQASKKNLAITSIPITTNPITRESRLVKSVWSYIKRMGATILRFYAMHEPLKAFFYFSLPFFLLGIPAIFRFLWFTFTEKNGAVGHIQSLLLGSACIIIGVLVMLIGLLADLISNNRHLVEDALFRIKKIELEVEKQKNREDMLLEELRALRQAITPNFTPANGSAGIQLPSRIEEVEVETVNPLTRL